MIFNDHFVGINNMIELGKGERGKRYDFIKKVQLLVEDWVAI